MLSPPCKTTASCAQNLAPRRIESLGLKLILSVRLRFCNKQVNRTIPQKKRQEIPILRRKSAGRRQYWRQVDGFFSGQPCGSFPHRAGGARRAEAEGLTSEDPNAPRRSLRVCRPARPGRRLFPKGGPCREGGRVGLAQSEGRDISGSQIARRKALSPRGAAARSAPRLLSPASELNAERAPL
jgi:hypothetical protein